jgi:hypothetical protein
VLSWLFGRRLAAIFRYCTGDINMATRKTRSKTKRAAKVKNTNTAKPTMTEQLREAQKRYTVSKSAKDSTSAHNGDDVATLVAGNSPEIVLGANSFSTLKIEKFPSQIGFAPDQCGQSTPRPCGQVI